MNFDFEMYQLELEDEMDQALESYSFNLHKINVGRANPKILEPIKFMYYGTLTPISQASQISVPEPSQLLIKPFDTATVRDIYGAINASGMNLNPVNEGDKIRIKFSALTTERRRELVKSLNTFTEQARIGIRAARHKIKKLIDDAKEISEDDQKRYLDEVQRITDKYNLIVEKMTEEKEKELMTI